MSNRLVQLELFHLCLPFRRWFSRSPGRSAKTDTVLVAALLADGTVGWGEGLPQSKVTGETVESVFFNIKDTLADCLDKTEPESFPQLLDLADKLPFTNSQGQIIHTARCCVELALLDAYGKYFGRPLSSISEWLGFGGFFGDGSINQIRVSGVLDGSIGPARMAHQFRLMRWYGLRDFKLEMGFQHDIENLQLVYRHLRPRLERQQASLRVDAGGAWDIDTATAMCEKLVDYDVCCVEQPLDTADHSHLHTLASLSPIPLMADESLISLNDGRFLAENDFIDFFNIRISKNGGLLPALRLAELAAKHFLGGQLGALPGESGILTAAERHFLQMVPNIDFTETAYATFSLRQDIVDRKMRFGYGGKLDILDRSGLGIGLRRKNLGKFVIGLPGKIHLT